MTDDRITAAPGQPPEMARRIFEPPSGLVLTAISRNKLIILVVAVVLAVIGLGVGVRRTPTYTAATTLQVGTENLNSPGFDGFVQAAGELATVFSRAISAAPVLTELQSKLGVTPSEAAQRLSAEPIPLSPSFRIVATGFTAKGAIDLANTASLAVIAYEQKAANTASPQAAALLKEYSSAAQAEQQDLATVENLSAGSYVKSAKGGTVIIHTPSKALVKARAIEAAARARAAAIESSYRSVTVAAAGSSTASGLISLVAAAATTTDDRSSKIKLFVLVGFFMGLVIGCAVAVLREGLRMNRRFAPEMEAGAPQSDTV